MRKLRSLVVAMVIAMTAVVCVPMAMPQNNVQVVEAASVKLNKKSASLNVGGTTTLKISGTSKTVTWSSSNKSVATVSSKGKVTAKAMGQATITAKVSGKKYTCKITVNSKKTLTAGGSATTLKVYGTSKKVTWTTPNTSVVSVNKTTGKVTPKAAGRAAVYAKVNGSTFAKCTVTVNASKTLSAVGKTATLKVYGTDSSKVTWSTENTSVVIVNKYTGKVTAKGAGTAIVYAKLDGSTYAKYTVRVNNWGTISDLGNSMQLKLNGVNRSKAVWSTPNYKVVTVNKSTGKLKAVGMGVATIYAKYDGKTLASWKITVNDKQTLSAGDTKTLSVYGTTKAVTWKTSNSSVVSVNKSTGKITAKTPGTAVITAVVGGSTFAKCTVTVSSPADELESYVKKNGAIEKTDDYDVEELKGVIGFVGELPVDVIPVTSKISYNSSTGNLVFESSVEATVNANDVGLGRDEDLSVISVITMEHNIVNGNVQVTGEVFLNGVFFDQPTSIGSAVATVDASELTPAVITTVIEDIKVVEMGFEEVSINNIIFGVINDNTDMEVTDEDFLEAINYQANFAFHKWDSLLDTVGIADFEDLGFTSYK